MEPGYGNWCADPHREIAGTPPVSIGSNLSPVPAVPRAQPSRPASRARGGEEAAEVSERKPDTREAVVALIRDKSDGRRRRSASSRSTHVDGDPKPRLDRPVRHCDGGSPRRRRCRRCDRSASSRHSARYRLTTRLSSRRTSRREKKGLADQGDSGDAGSNRCLRLNAARLHAADLARRDDQRDGDEMPKAAAPYVHPKLATTEHTGKDGGPINSYGNRPNSSPQGLGSSAAGEQRYS